MVHPIYDYYLYLNLKADYKYLIRTNDKSEVAKLKRKHGKKLVVESYEGIPRRKVVME